MNKQKIQIVPSEYTTTSYALQPPFMEVPKEKGYGIYGAPLYDPFENKVICNECGKWFYALSGHLIQTHLFINVQTYKEKWLMIDKIALCVPSVSKKCSKNIKERLKNGILKQRRFTVENQKNRNQNKMTEMQCKAYNTVTYKNWYGRTYIQLNQRLKKIKSKIGHSPTAAEIQSYDPPLLTRLETEFGSLNKAKKYFGLKTYPISLGFNKPHTIQRIIKEIRALCIKLGKIPTQKDTRQIQGLCIAIYRRIGSLRQAKKMAGLDLLLQEIKGR